MNIPFSLLLLLFLDLFLLYLLLAQRLGMLARDMFEHTVHGRAPGTCSLVPTSAGLLKRSQALTGAPLAACSARCSCSGCVRTKEHGVGVRSCLRCSNMSRVLEHAGVLSCGLSCGVAALVAAKTLNIKL